MDTNSTRKALDAPKNVQDVIEIMGRRGMEVDPKDIDDAWEVARAQQRQLEQQASIVAADGWRGWVDTFNRYYPKFLQTLLGIGDVFLTVTQTIFIAFGVPGILVALLIVEQQRVDHGIGLFETSPELTALCATALVLGNLLFELLISWKENQVAYTEPPKFEFSFRILAGRIAYMLGRSTSWKPRPKSPAQRFKNVLKVITFTILILALAGSMRSVIEETKGSWSDAIVYIFTKSTLLQAVTWLGGLLFAIAAVQAAQAVSQYVAQKVIVIAAIMQSNSQDKSKEILDATGLAAAAFLMARMTEKRRIQRQVSVVASAMPQSAVSGVVSVPIVDKQQTDATEEDALTPDDAGFSFETKIDRAIAILRTDRSLKNLSSRHLAARYPDINFRTWALAKQRTTKGSVK